MGRLTGVCNVSFLSVSYSTIIYTHSRRVVQSSIPLTNWSNTRMSKSNDGYTATDVKVGEHPLSPIQRKHMFKDHGVKEFTFSVCKNGLADVDFTDKDTVYVAEGYNVYNGHIYTLQGKEDTIEYVPSDQNTDGCMHIEGSEYRVHPSVIGILKEMEEVMISGSQVNIYGYDYHMVTYLIKGVITMKVRVVGPNGPYLVSGVVYLA